jgi:tetraacyldisaccharide 4'-kinase
LLVTATGDPRLTLQRTVRPALYPAAWLYGLGQAARRLAYRRGLLTATAVDKPVVSVGALCAGGVGKTPFVRHVAGRLDARRVAILSRGYGGGYRGHLRVQPDTEVPEAGDEPVLLARTSDAVIWLGRDRARLALELTPQYDVLLLDDGYQHLRLARDLNICLVPDEPWGPVLPAGLWRESPRALRDAHMVIGAGALPAWATRHHDGPTGVITFTPGPWQTRGPEAQLPERIFAFCGIARPQRFFASFHPEQVAGTRAFPDHHAYTPADLEALTADAERAGAGALVTTAKDAVRLPSIRDLPVYWRDVDVEWLEGESKFAELLHAAVTEPPRRI